MVVDHGGTLLVLLVILTLGLVIPELFRKFRMPFVTIILVLGALLGPNGLNYIQFNDIISFQRGTKSKV